jgi:hypothetical protein
MPSLLETLQQHLGGGVTEQISRQLGADRSTTSTAMAAALPVLLGALARNASNGTGAAELHGALSKDHDGSILDSLSGVIGRPAEQNVGSSILQHVLGRRQNVVQRGLSQTTGLDTSQVGSLLAMLAPVVLGALGRMQRQNNLDPSNLSHLLGQEKTEIQKRAPHEMSRLESLLDADGDGDVDLSDLSKKGLGALGGLFGG